MRLKEHARESARTINHDLSPFARRKATWLGLIGEVGEAAELMKHQLTDKALSHEIFTKTLSRELGDFIWYVQDASRLSEKGIDDVAGGIVEDNDIVDLALSAAIVANGLKHDVYGFSFSTELQCCVDHVHSIARAHGLEFGEILQANIDKLRIRHPGGWSAERSRERNTKPADGLPGYHHQHATADTGGNDD